MGIERRRRFAFEGVPGMASAGDELQDVGGLFGACHTELRRLASRYLAGERAAHTLQPTALVNEAYLRIRGEVEASGEVSVHLRAQVGRAMRQILVEHARRRAADKRGGGAKSITLATDMGASDAEEGVDALDLEEALGHLEALDPNLVRVVELRYFGGLTVDEVAQELKRSATAVKNDWRVARAILADKLGGGS